MTQDHFIKYYIQNLHTAKCVVVLFLTGAYFDGNKNHLIIQAIYFGSKT